MTVDELLDFIRRARVEFANKQNALIDEYRLQQYPEWRYDQRTQEITFLCENGEAGVVFDTLAIGSYQAEDGTWMWAWANLWDLPEVRERSRALAQLYDITGFDFFQRGDPFELPDESMVKHYVALAVQHVGAMGAYRMRSTEEEGVTSFVALMGMKSLH